MKGILSFRKLTAFQFNLSQRAKKGRNMHHEGSFGKINFPGRKKITKVFQR